MLLAGKVLRGNGIHPLPCSHPSALNHELRMFLKNEVRDSNALVIEMSEFLALVSCTFDVIHPSQPRVELGEAILVCTS
jgi:hypothetical protein